MLETPVLDPDRIPRHVAIIMDGNGRWAKERSLPRIMGHKAGSESVRDIVRAARELEIKVLTLYAFSTENWKRPAIEVQGIMALLKTYLKSEARSMAENNISLRCIGEQERLPREIGKILSGVIRDTAPGPGEEPGMVLNLALSYGSRSEILRAARTMAEKCVSGQFEPADFTEKLFASHLYTSGLPDPDLLIRTGGEARLSNFLLWQLSYAELYITETMWPDFNRERFIETLRYYQGRERRFGQTSEQLKAE
ncbi:MAG: isoprenyl transferase [Deltaproteobacteria bacterium]|jgi:undecaprenyl diphosphate synthase|nr:isoprenyl transferase [Deltaproteobacteria bacterium]